LQRRKKVIVNLFGYFPEAEMASKFIEEIKTMSVMDLVNLVKEIEETFGVSAAAPVAVASAVAAPAAAAVDEKIEFNISIEEAGADKIKVIKALRLVVPTLSLKDAKDKVEAAPSVVAEAVSKADAEKIKKALEEAGAKVKLS